MFVGLHVALARLTEIDEIEITEDEGKLFMERAQAVASHYSVSTTQKTMDWIAFAGCACGIYAPRIVAVMRKRGEKDRHSPAPMQPPPQPVQQYYSVVPDGPPDVASE